MSLGFNYNIIRPLFTGGHMSDSQVEGIERLLTAFNAPGSGMLDPRMQAYGLATVFRETGATMQPIKEWGAGKGKSYYPYYGRGDVQLTWLYNYQRFGPIVGVNLVANPDLALSPPISAKIAVIGMTKGLFTGKKLSDYFTAKTSDPVNARRIINGLDDSEEIAGHYKIILKGF